VPAGFIPVRSQAASTSGGLTLGGLTWGGARGRDRPF